MNETALQEKTAPQIVPFHKYFEAKKGYLTDVIPKHLTPERIVKIAISALMRTPALMACTPQSIWLCVANAATLGLEVNLLGSAYLIPFRNRKTGGSDCQLIVR